MENRSTKECEHKKIGFVLLLLDKICFLSVDGETNAEYHCSNWDRIEENCRANKCSIAMNS